MTRRIGFSNRARKVLTLELIATARFYVCVIHFKIRTSRDEENRDLGFLPAMASQLEDSLTICSIRASSKGDKGAAGGGGEEEDGESTSALLILSGSAAIICSANVSTLASSSPIKRNHHPSQTRKCSRWQAAGITTPITTPRF